MARFTREELESFRDHPVDDVIGPGLRLLFVGINPGLWTAVTNTHFCHPSNRFYPALRRTGIIDWDLDPEVGMTDAQRRDFIAAGLGITNLVNRATVRASELDPAELREGAARLAGRVAQLRPAVVAVAGVTAYRTAFARPGTQMGRQPEGLESSELWVVPNPSGLNANETVDSLADWYRRVAATAGVL